MKSTMKFEINKSTSKVNFLDVTVINNNGVLKTTLFSKTTDAHLYLNSSSCHPPHVIKNIPKGQFIRVRRICSDKSDYYRHSNTMMTYFSKRGYHQPHLQKTIKQVAEIPRDDLLMEKLKPKKDPQSIFVCDWHPSLSKIPSILKNHYHIIENDHKLRSIFPTEPTIAFRKMKTIRNHLVRSDIKPQGKITSTSTVPCGKCKTCKNINTNTSITNTQKGLSFKLRDGGNCKSSGVIYAAQCKIHNLIYIGHTGEKLSERFSKHRYDIKKRPDNSELARHFHVNHDIDNDMDVTILQSNINETAARLYFEDKWICQLQTLQPTGINAEVNAYAREMYECFAKSK